MVDFQQNAVQGPASPQSLLWYSSGDSMQRCPRPGMVLRSFTSFLPNLRDYMGRNNGVLLYDPVSYQVFCRARRDGHLAISGDLSDLSSERTACRVTKPISERDIPRVNYIISPSNDFRRITDIPSKWFNLRVLHTCALTQAFIDVLSS